MSEKVRKHIIFYGRVQGVGFRYYSVYKSRQLGLTGWVRNLYDGTVEMEVQGEQQVIDQLIVFLQNQRLKIWTLRRFLLWMTMIFMRGNNIDYMDCYLLCTITICLNICIL